MRLSFMTYLPIAVLCLAACSAPAWSQSTVALYGVADAGLVRESGGAGGGHARVASGIASASRIGLRGSESLGAGMSAIFTLEGGVRLDTGEADSAGLLFNRQAYAGIKSGYGTLTVGRQYTPYHTTLTGVADPFGTGLAGTAKNLFPDSGNNVRTNNTVLYAMPGAHGWSGEVAFSLGEQASSKAGRQWGAAAGYASGKLNLRLAWNSKNGDTAAAPGVPPVRRGNGRNTLFAANYDAGPFKAYLAYGADKGFNSAPLGNAGNPYGGVRPVASLHGDEILLGFSAPAGNGTLVGSLMRKNDKTALDQDASAWGVGYLYPLSRRSTAYGAYARVANRRGAGYTVGNNADPGAGNRAFNLGLRHTF